MNRDEPETLGVRDPEEPLSGSFSSTFLTKDMSMWSCCVARRRR